MRLIDAESTRAALPFSWLIPALRERFISGCEVPLRHVHQVHPVQAGQGSTGELVTSLLMPSWQPEGRYGVKIVIIAPGNAAPCLPSMHSSYLLHDADTGVPLALIDGGLTHRHVYGWPHGGHRTSRRASTEPQANAAATDRNGRAAAAPFAPCSTLDRSFGSFAHGTSLIAAPV